MKQTPLIFFIATSGNRSAVAKEFLAIAEELLKCGHRVHLITNRIPDRSPAGKNHGLQVHSWPSARPIHWRDAAFLVKLVRAYKPDCVVANFGAVNVITLVGALLGVPVRVAWYHTLSSQIGLDDERKMPIRKKWLRIRKKWVYRFASHIVAVSQAASQDCHNAFGVARRKIHSFYNSLEDPWMRHPALKDIKRDKHKLICVGRLDYSKGQDIVIRAVAQLQEKFSNLQVEFIGDGLQRGPYEQLAKELDVADKCRFRGAVGSDDVFKCLASSSVAIVPSRSEAFGLVTIGAMAIGVPVIAANIEGIAEVIKGSDGVVTFSPGQSAELADCIKKLLSDENLQIRMGRNARRHFLENFELGKIVEEKADWLERISREAVSER